MWLRRATVAGAMALGWPVIAAPAEAAPTTAPAEALSSVSPGQVPSFDEIDSLNPTTQPTPLVAPFSEPPINPPTAPLPSALLAGTATMAIAGWITWRIRRRGGRI